MVLYFNFKEKKGWIPIMEETNSNKNLIKRLLIRFFIGALIILFTIYTLPKLIQLLFPFILAFILAVIFNPAINKVNSWLHKLNIKSPSSRNLITFIFTIIILGFVSFLSYYLFAILIKEIISLATSIQKNWPTIVITFENIQKWIITQIDVMPGETIEMINNFTVSILDFIKNLSRNLLNITVTATGTVISGTGSFFFKFLTFFLSFYFMIADFNLIKNYIKNHIDQRVINTVTLLKNSTLKALGGYLKTQIFFAFTAFIFMFVAFIMYGQDYALILALILGIVDLLPLVGTSAVLLPWGVLEYFFGTPQKAIFLIIISISFFIFRRLAEPKVMGNQTGLHPLLALISIYVGIQYSGLWGAFLGPLVILLIISILDSGLLDGTIDDVRLLYYKTIIALQK